MNVRYFGWFEELKRWPVLKSDGEVVIVDSLWTDGRRACCGCGYDSEKDVLGALNLRKVAGGEKS